MTEQPTANLQDDTNINPYVSTLATKLMQTAANAEMKFDSNGWQIISEVLSYAASAEQRMAEQEYRIEYLEQLSLTDELTGIANRRGLKQSLRRTLASAARHNESGVLGFLDLDDFKEVNDKYGHNAGDAVLRHVAKALKNHVRPDDIVARMAGDEFAIVLKRCSPKQGKDRLKRLQQSLNAGSVRYKRSKITIGCSIGVHHYNGKSSFEELINAADMAMYDNKVERKPPQGS